MSSYSSQPSSSRPDGMMGPEEDDFRVAPAPGAGMPSGTTGALGRSRAPGWHNANQTVLFFAVGGGLVLLAAAAVAVVAWLFSSPTALPPPTPGEGTPVSALQAATTAVAVQNWPAALTACADLLKSPPAGEVDNQALGNTYYACGKHLVQPDSANVDAALPFFEQAQRLLPNNTDIKQQIALADRYQTAKLTLLNDVDVGGYIDKLEWFDRQPEFSNQPYADTRLLLYKAYIGSGKGYQDTSACDLAKNRYQQAATVKGVDTSDAVRLLKETLQSCK